MRRIGQSVAFGQQAKQMITDVAVRIELYPDGIVLIIRQRNSFKCLTDSYGAEFLINIQIVFRELCYERIFFVRNDCVNQRHASSPRFVDAAIAPSPNRRIAIALQISPNSLGDMRLVSARSLTDRCFVPMYKSFAAQNRV